MEMVRIHEKLAVQEFCRITCRVDVICHQIGPGKLLATTTIRLLRSTELQANFSTTPSHGQSGNRHHGNDRTPLYVRVFGRIYTSPSLELSAIRSGGVSPECPIRALSLLSSPPSSITGMLRADSDISFYSSISQPALISTPMFLS